MFQPSGGYLGSNTSGSSLNGANRTKTLRYWYSWVVNNKKHLRGSARATIHPLAIIPTAALWALVSIIAEYWDPHTASSVFLILLVTG